MRPPRLFLLLAAAGAAAYGLGLLVEIGVAAPPCCGLTWPSRNPLQAEQRLMTDDPRGANPVRQRQAALAILAGRPGDASAWVRLARADRLLNGRMTEVGRFALQTSYLAQPYGGDQTPLRVALALDNWGQLSHQTRQDAVAEMSLVRKYDYKRLPVLRAVAPRAADPGGRLAALLVLGP